jgi:cytochrome c-type biogenesis protein CcmH
MGKQPASDDPAWAPTEQAGGDERPDAGVAQKRARRPSTSRWLIVGVVVALAGALLWFIAQRGGKSDASVAASASGGSAADSKTLSTDQLRQSIEKTAEKVKMEPNNSSAWAMLAHSQAMLGDFDAARKSYAQLAALLPNDAQVLADYADAAGVAQGRKLAGEPATLIAKALALDPKNLKALALAGREAFERKNYGQAIAFWERARALAKDTVLSAEIDANIAEARAFDGRDRPPQSVVSRPGGAAISGRLTLAPALASKVSPGDTVFVYARPLKGSRMPVALLRKKVSDLPLDFTLDDSMAMVPDIKLSMLSSVAVGARISKRGDATPQAGDLQGLVESVDLGSKGVKLEIREVVK